MKTLILYHGPSAFDGEPIVALLTAGSANKKTGPMPTVWVLHAEIDPWEAVRVGADKAVCGDCPQRKTAPTRDAPQCYTYGNVLRAAAGMLKALHRGSYLDGTNFSVEQLREYLSACAHFGQAKAIRSCAYGDMAAVHIAAWEKLDRARRIVGLGVRGYTHQWRSAHHLRQTHMASVHTLQTAQEAQALGWRTFLSNDPTKVDLPSGGVLCLASKEAGHRTNCTECTLCSGAHRAGAPSVYIADHGPNAQGRRLSIQRSA